MSDLVLILSPSDYRVNLLRRGDLLLTRDSQSILYLPLYLVVDAFHLIIGSGTMIKFSVFPKDAPSCYQELLTVLCVHVWYWGFLGTSSIIV